MHSRRDNRSAAGSLYRSGDVMAHRTLLATDGERVGKRRPVLNPGGRACPAKPQAMLIRGLFQRGQLIGGER